MTRPVDYPFGMSQQQPDDLPEDERALISDQPPQPNPYRNGDFDGEQDGDDDA